MQTLPDRRFNNSCLSNNRSFLTGFNYLPLSLLGLLETLEDAHNLLQGCQPGPQLIMDLFLVVSKLGVKVLPVRASSHGSTEDGLDEEAMMGLESGAISGAERVGQFLGAGGDITGESDGSEFETTMG